MEGVKIRRSPPWLIWLPRAWFAVVAIVLLWLTLTYRGISAFAAEWEFNAFGLYHPAFSFLLLLLLLCTPLLLLRLPLKRARARRDALPPDAQLNYRISITSRLIKTLYGTVAAIAIAALVIAMIGFFLPSAAGPVSKAVVNDTAAPPKLGPVQLSGRLLSDRTAVFIEDFVFAKRSNRFAPMVGDNADPSVLHYFVELPPDVAPSAPNTVTVRTGVLRKGGLPGELVSLYRYAGFRVDPDYYVLFASQDSMRRPYYTNALELVILALFVAIIAFIYNYRRRRLRGLTPDRDGEDSSL